MASSANYIRDGRSPIPAKESTSKVMRANKAKNTKPELLFRKALWHTGLRGYRLHKKDLPGKPDLIFSKNKVAIFVNGCFWHRCKLCNPTAPKSNIEFWNTKFENNENRDKLKKEKLELLGWNVVYVWDFFYQNGQQIFIKEIVPKKQLFALYALNKISTIANTKPKQSL